MQKTSELYNELLAAYQRNEPNVRFKTTLVIDKEDAEGQTFDESELIEIKTTGRLFPDGTPSVGNCITTEIELSMFSPAKPLPRNARIKPYVRLTDGVRESEKIQKGLFYIDTRKEKDAGLDRKIIRIHGYDGLLKSEQDYPPSILAWPASPLDVAREICAFLGIGLDPETEDILRDDVTVIQYPGQYSCREVLGYIAAACGGNFVISDTGNLKLVQLCGKKIPEGYGIITVPEHCTTMHITYSAVAPHEHIHFAVWNQTDGADSVHWYAAEMNEAGEWNYTVDLRAHNSTGNYNIHVYSIDNGVYTKLAEYTANVEKLPQGYGSITISDDHTTMTVTYVPADPNANVHYAVWSDEGGQDDLQWYSAEIDESGAWNYTVDLRAHNSTGKYNIHVYRIDNGVYTKLAEYTADVNGLPISAGNVTVFRSYEAAQGPISDDGASNAIDIGKRMRAFSSSEEIGPYERVVVTVDENTTYIHPSSAGDSARTLTVECPWGSIITAVRLYALFRDFRYQPFLAEQAILDPAAELGDTIRANGILSRICTMDLTFGPGFRATVSAPFEEELEHEYPYVSKRDRTINRKMGAFSSELKVQASEISAKVSKNGGDASSFGWNLTDKDWSLLSNGKTTLRASVSGLEVYGKIEAYSGKIGLFTIANGALATGEKTFRDGKYGVYIGSDGINLGSGFSVTPDGYLTAMHGTFLGTVTAGNIIYGGDYGYFNGSGIDTATIYGNRLVGNTVTTAYTSTGINAALENGNWAANLFSGVTDYNASIKIGTVSCTTLYKDGYGFYRKSVSFKDGSGNNITIPYWGWSA